MNDLKEKIWLTLIVFSLIGYLIVIIIGAITNNFIIIGICLIISIIAFISCIIFALYEIWRC